MVGVLASYWHYFVRVSLMRATEVNNVLCTPPPPPTQSPQFNLAGMKCSCGIHCTPAFKIPRQRVDESLEGGDAGETLAAALAADARLGGGGAGSGDEGGDEEGTEEERAARARRKAKSKALTVPVSKAKGSE